MTRSSMKARVESVGDRGALLHYTDRISKGNEGHVHRCRQEIEVNELGRVISIRHVDIDGERESLASFNARHGL